MSRRLRAAAGRRLHRIIDRRIEEKVDWIVSHARHVALREHQVFGPPDRLELHDGAKVNDALFNTASGRIVVHEHAFFGHGVAVLTGTHDVDVLGPARQDAIPDGGRDVEIGRGAWVASRATVLGPCRIGEDAVVCAGAVVTGDVPDRAIVAGVPARVVRSAGAPGLPPAIDVATDVGRLYLHAHDEVLTPDIAAAGGMEDEDLKLLRQLATPGTTVVDVGANVGYSTLAAAQAVGPDGAVVAIEPHPANLHLLRANVARNHAAHVRVVPGAAWHEEGTTHLAEATTNTGDHRAGTTIDGRRSITVATVRIDDVVDRAGTVSVIKLDTQATEHHALRGASATLAAHRPTLLAEFWPQGIRERGEDPADVLKAFASLGYERTTVVEAPELTDLPDAELVDAVHARPAPHGGFVTLELRPSA